MKPLHILILSFWSCYACAHSASPFAIHFSPTTLIASRLNASSSLEIFKLPTTQDLRAYYAQEVRNYGRYSNDHSDDDDEIERLKPMLAAAFDTLQKHLQSQLGMAPEVSTLATPSVLGWEFRAAAAAVALPEEYPDRPTLVFDMLRAAYHAYGFLQCQNLNRTQEQCNEDGPPNVIILLEYEKEYLQIKILVVDFEAGVCFPLVTQMCLDCGENYLKGIGPERYNKRLRENIQAALNEKDVGIYKPEDFRAIFTAGEASTTANRNIESIAQKAVGSITARILTSIESSDVVAHGGAVLSRLTRTSPRRFRVPHSYKDDKHDEL